MNGRVVDAGADAALAHGLHDLLARLGRAALQALSRQHHLEHVPVGGGGVRIQRLRQLDAQRFQAAVGGTAEIRRGQFGSARGDGVKLAQLRQADRGVDVGQVELAAGLFDIHAIHAGADHALQPQALGAHGFFGRVHHQAAAFDGGDVLVGLEAEADQVAKGADALAAPARVDCLRGILDHAQPVLAGNGVQAVHVHRQARQVHRHDGARARRDRGLDGIQVEIARARVNVDEHRPRAHCQHHVGSGDPGDWRGDDLIARPDIGNAQRDFHRCRAVGEGAHRASAEQVRQRGLEGLHLRAGGDPARGQHLADFGNGGGVDVRPDKRQEFRGRCGHGRAKENGRCRTWRRAGAS